MITLRRLLMLWRLHATLDLLFVSRRASVAVGWYAADVIIGVSSITAVFLLAERFDGIGPWTRPQVGFLLGFALMVRGLVNLLFNYNVAFISRRIGRGQLDHILIQPQPLWMALLTEGFAPFTGAGEALPGLLVLIWSISELNLPLSVAWFALLALQLISAAAIVLAFSYAWGSLAFWAPRAAEEVNSSTWRLLTQLHTFPLDGLPGIVLGGLVTVVPVGLVAWYPARALLGFETSPLQLALVPAAALLLGAVALGIFMRGLRHYGQTGSTRYLPWGHRS